MDKAPWIEKYRPTQLADIVLEPYNRQLALDAIQRLQDTQVLLWQLDPEANPKNWELIPTTPSLFCSYCPWFLPNSQDGSKGCPGEVGAA
jgi:hypothetical protein